MVRISKIDRYGMSYNELRHRLYMEEQLRNTSLTRKIYWWELFLTPRFSYMRNEDAHAYDISAVVGTSKRNIRTSEWQWQAYQRWPCESIALLQPSGITIHYHFQYVTRVQKTRNGVPIMSYFAGERKRTRYRVKNQFGSTYQAQGIVDTLGSGAWKKAYNMLISKEVDNLCLDPSRRLKK